MEKNPAEVSVCRHSRILEKHRVCPSRFAALLHNAHAHPGQGIEKDGRGSMSATPLSTPVRAGFLQ